MIKPQSQTTQRHDKYVEYRRNCERTIQIDEFDISTVSFTYGDSHPTFSDRVNDGKEYRKKVYTYVEILEIIEKIRFSRGVE
jgi:hypothetical protein